MKEQIEEKLREYFKDYGWAYRFDGDKTFYSGWRSEDKDYSLKLRLDGSLLSFEVKLLPLREHIQDKDWKYTLEFLMRMNRQLSTVKLALDDEDDLVLGTEFFSEQLNYKHLSKVLGVIGYYTEKVQEELLHNLSESYIQDHPTHKYLI